MEKDAAWRENSDGCYSLRLCDPRTKQWCYIVVDDYFPYNGLASRPVQPPLGKSERDVVFAAGETLRKTNGILREPRGSC